MREDIMSKQESPTIRTSRLILRRKREKDIPFMLDLFGNLLEADFGGRVANAAYYSKAL